MGHSEGTLHELGANVGKVKRLGGVGEVNRSIRHLVLEVLRVSMGECGERLRPWWILDSLS